ncbi:hypothetical protein [Methylobacterium sp. JK268]
MILLLLAGLPLPTFAQPEASRRLLVREGALLCVSRFSFAVAARAAQDARWLAENGCLRAGRGFVVLRLADTARDAGGPAWTVRVVTGGPAGLALWGHPADFRLESGEPVPPEN